jgi:DUF4097 and DUF4098 domain-containing protein YvlB
MAVSTAHLTGRATDEWTRHYTLARGGEIVIVNRNGRVDVDGVDGNEVDVRAERIARAATDTGARELLQRITITEHSTPERVSLETERMSGIMIGAATEVRYHVRAPRDATVNLQTTNGTISVSALTGKVTAHSTNGLVSGKQLTGAVDAETTNGGVNIDLAEVGANPVSLHTTNGGVTLGLPDRGKATLTASWTNGGFRLAPELKMEVLDQSRRRFEGRLNGGGAAIDLHTTNGGIRVKARDGETAETAEPDPDDQRKERQER